MRKYLEVFKIHFRSQLAWRFDVFMSVAFSFFRVLLAFILWRAVYGGREIVGGYTFAQMLSYYICTSFLSQLDLSGSMAQEIGDRIKNGTFSGRMVVPCNIKGYFYAQTLGAAAFNFSFSLLSALAWILVFHGQTALTQNVVLIAEAFLIAALGIAFMLQLHFLLGIFAFKYTEVWVFLMIKNNILAVISGTIIPLSMLPGALLSLLRYLPFYYVTYLPGMLLIGKNANEAVSGIIILCAWNLLMAFINHFTYERLRTRYDGVGI